MADRSKIPKVGWSQSIVEGQKLTLWPKTGFLLREATVQEST